MSRPRRTIEDSATEIVDAIIEDLRQRDKLYQAWETLGPSWQRLIRELWIEIVVEKR